MGDECSHEVSLVTAENTSTGTQAIFNKEIWAAQR